MGGIFSTKEWSPTKYKILEASIQLFSLKGYSAVSVREITGAVGIKESALYNHFKNKEEILISIYHLFRAEHARTRPDPERFYDIVDQSNPEQFLRQGLDIFKRTVENPLHEKMWRILNIEQFRDQRARQIILEDVYTGTINFLEKAFQIFIEKKLIKPLNPRVLAIQYQYTIFSMMTEYLLLRHDGQDTKPVVQKMNDHLHFFLNYINL